jgi:hypothetical protein
MEENTPQAVHVAGVMGIADPSKSNKSKSVLDQEPSSIQTNSSNRADNSGITAENSSKKRSGQPSSQGVNSNSSQVPKSDEPANKKTKRS